MYKIKGSVQGKILLCTTQSFSTILRYMYLLHPLRVEVTSINSFKMATASSDLHTRYTKERGNEVKVRNGPDISRSKHNPTFRLCLWWQIVEFHGANCSHNILHQLNTTVQHLVSEGPLQSETNFSHAHVHVSTCS